MWSAADTEAEGNQPAPAQLRADCERIAAMVLPPPPPAPAVDAPAGEAATAPAPAADAPPADAAAMAVEDAAVPSAAAAADPSAPAKLPDATVRELLTLAAPLDGALFGMKRKLTIIPRGSFHPSSWPAFDGAYAAYESDARRRSAGVLLPDGAAVRAFLAALLGALADPATAIVVKGAGDLPVLANTCAHHGLAWDPASVAPRVVDIGTDATYHFWRAVMYDGQLGPNASAALRAI